MLPDTEPVSSAPEHYIKGREFILLNKPEDALRELKEAIRLEPEFVEAHQEYIELMLLLNKKDEIKAEYKTFLATHEDKAMAHYLWSKIIDDIKILREENEKAIQIDPNFFYAYGGMAFYFIQIREYDKALSFAQKSIELNPKYARGYQIIGTIYNIKNNFDKGLENFRKSLELDPLLSLTYLALSTSYGERGRYDEVIKITTMVLETDKKPITQLEGYINRGTAYVHKKEISQARDNFLKAKEIAQEEKLPDLCFMIAMAFWNIEDDEQALAILEESLKYNPPPQLAKQIQKFINNIKTAKNK
jgi:superkiller protein 3